MFFASSVLLNRLFPVAMSLYPEWRKNTMRGQIRRIAGVPGDEHFRRGVLMNLAKGFLRERTSWAEQAEFLVGVR
jgi:hypothetical protein